jgi:hypothetical protein
MLDPAAMQELLDDLEERDEPDLAPAHAFLYSDVLDAIASRWDIRGEDAYRAVHEWLDGRGEILEWTDNERPALLLLLDRVDSAEEG